MKIRNLLTMFLIAATLVGCGTGANSSNDSSTGNSTSSLTNPVTENVVKIKKIDVNENQSQVQNIKARNIKKANDDSTEELNYTIITRPQSEVQFTITLDNPKAYGINALEISCDDENAEIMIEGEYKKISDYSIVLWSSENAYEKTYNIKTDSLDELTSLKVTDIRLEGETKFQSELTNSTDLGNNELQIYKMDTDAYELDVVSNTFEEIKFGIKVKEGVTNLSNFKVDGKEPDENGYWVMNESKEDCEISYDFELENGIKVSRSSERWIGPMEMRFMNGEYSIADNSKYIKHIYNDMYGVEYYQFLYVRVPYISSASFIVNDNVLEIEPELSDLERQEYEINIFSQLGFDYFEYAEETNTTFEDDNPYLNPHRMFWWEKYYPYLEKELGYSNVLLNINDTKYQINFEFDTEKQTIATIVSLLEIEQ